MQVRSVTRKADASVLSKSERAATVMPASYVRSGQSFLWLGRPSVPAVMTVNEYVDHDD